MIVSQGYTTNGDSSLTADKRARSREANHTMLSRHAGPEIAVFHNQGWCWTKSQPLPSLAKAKLARLNGNEKSSTRFRSLNTFKERIDYAPLKQIRDAFYIGRGQDYYVCHGSHSLGSKRFLTSTWRFCGWEPFERLLWLKMGTPVLALLSDPQPHSREISKKGSAVKVPTIARKGKNRRSFLRPYTRPISHHPWSYQRN